MRRSGAAPALLFALAVAGGAAAPAALAAQGASGSDTPAAVRYGKWGAAALFVAFTAAGAIEHNEAEVRFRALESWCISTGPCTIGPDGRYASPAAESMYQGVIQRDRTARVWFLSGQLALGGAAALFVAELLHDHGTQNVPYSGLVVGPGAMGTTRIGWRVRF